MASDYGNLGILAQTRGNLEQAEEYYTQALALNKELGRKEGMANQYANLGILAKTRGNVPAARAYWQQSVDLFQQIGMPHMVEKVRGWLDALPPDS